jgi:hypothetical protein
LPGMITAVTRKGNPRRVNDDNSAACAKMMA